MYNCLGYKHRGEATQRLCSFIFISYLEAKFMILASLGGGYHGALASLSSHLRSLSSNLRSLSSHLIFTYCELHIFKLSIFTSSVFTPVISPHLRFFKLKNANLQSSKTTGTPTKFIPKSILCLLRRLAFSSGVVYRQPRKRQLFISLKF